MHRKTRRPASREASSAVRQRGAQGLLLFRGPGPSCLTAGLAWRLAGRRLFLCNPLQSLQSYVSYGSVPFVLLLFLAKSTYGKKLACTGYLAPQKHESTCFDMESNFRRLSGLHLLRVRQQKYLLWLLMPTINSGGDFRGVRKGAKKVAFGHLRQSVFYVYKVMYMYIQSGHLGIPFYRNLCGRVGQAVWSCGRVGRASPPISRLWLTNTHTVTGTRRHTHSRTHAHTDNTNEPKQQPAKGPKIAKC